MRKLAIPVVLVAACFTKPGPPGVAGDGGPASDAPMSTTRITAFAAGDHHACAITADQRVMCWGDNRFGQLGGSAASAGAPVIVPGVAGATAIAAGTAHTCALTGTTVMCWGSDRYGQAQGGPEPHTVAISTIALDYAPTRIFAGGDATCTIDPGGTAGCWGDFENSGQPHTPATVKPAGRDRVWSAFALSADQSCALDGSGSVYCWGQNLVGEAGPIGSMLTLESPNMLSADAAEIAVAENATFARTEDGVLEGWGDVGFDGTQQLMMPTPLDSATGHRWDRIAAGRRHLCGIIGGQLKCFGADDFGATGAFVPTTLANIDAATLGAATAVTAGAGFTCVIDGQLAKCMGADQWGELGIGQVATAHVPVRVAGVTATQPYALAAGGGHSCVATTHGMTCWGDNTDGQITGSAGGVAAPPTETSLGGNPAGALTAGAHHTCAIDATGTLACIGLAAAYSAFGSPTRASEVAAGDDATCILDHGDLSCAGMGPTFNGGINQLGMPGNVAAVAVGTGRIVVEQVGSNSNAIDTYTLGGTCGDTAEQGLTRYQTYPAGTVQLVAQGIYSGRGEVCSLGVDGQIDCWGPGQPALEAGCTLPTGGSIGGASAYAITPLSYTVAGYHVCALGGGMRYCAGDNTDASFGLAGVDEAVESSASSGSLDNGSGWAAIASGPHHGCAIAGSDSSVWCWGLDRFGEVGDGKHAYATLVPVQLPP